MNAQQQVDAAFDIVPWIPAVVAAIAGGLAGIFAMLNRKGGEHARRQPTWVELVTENRLLRGELRGAADLLRTATSDQTDLRRQVEDLTDQVADRDRVFARVLKVIADGWPPDHPGPDLDHIVDLATIDDMLPDRWRRQPAGEIRNTPPTGETP